MDIEKNETILGINSNEPGKILKVHLAQEVDIEDTNKSGLPVSVKMKRGYNTILDVNTGQLYDPKHMG